MRERSSLPQGALVLVVALNNPVVLAEKVGIATLRARMLTRRHGKAEKATLIFIVYYRFLTFQFLPSADRAAIQEWRAFTTPVIMRSAKERNLGYGKFVSGRA